MQTRYGQSPWIGTFPASRRPDHPRLRGEHEVPVVIIGAGLTGCATALALATAGVRVAVIESDRIGLGTTGRGPGLLLPEPGPSFKDVAGAHGLRSAKRIFEAWRRASLDGAAQLRRLSIACGLEPRDSLFVVSRDDEKGLLREYDAREAAGVPVAWLTRKQVTAATPLDVPAAMRVRDGFALDPYRACVGLAVAAAKRGATFFERSRVTKVRGGKKHVEVLVDGGVVRSGTVIVATGTATAEFRPLARHFKRREAYLALSEPMPAAVRKQVGARTCSVRSNSGLGRRVSWTPDGRVLVVGADQDETPVKRRPEVLVQRTGQLMYETLTMYPAISGLRPEFGWEASYGATVDGLMYIGAHRNYPRHLFALGGGAESMTGAFLAARVLARAVQGAAEKTDQVFGWTR
jgi:glycine/D-amino acid oxidase-like deaminating enzyme